MNRDYVKNGDQVERPIIREAGPRDRKEWMDGQVEERMPGQEEGSWDESGAVNWIW